MTIEIYIGHERFVAIWTWNTNFVRPPGMSIELRVCVEGFVAKFACELQIVILRQMTHQQIHVAKDFIADVTSCFSLKKFERIIMRIFDFTYKKIKNTLHSHDRQLLRCRLIFPWQNSQMTLETFCDVLSEFPLLMTAC